jgi:CBS domain-containing protein
MLEQTVRRTMTRDVYAVSPATDLATAARLLVTHHIGGAPVIDSQGQVIGVVSLSDLADPDRGHGSMPGQSLFYRVHDHKARAIGDGGDPAVAEAGVVADVMSPYVLSIDPDASLVDAARLMVADDIHRLLVLDQGKLVGIISSMDVLRAIGAG